MLFSAELSAQDLAAAEALFNKGLEEMQKGNFKVGCPALAESHRLDPRAGTLFTLAECEAKAGKVATAVARYEDYLRAFERLDPAAQERQRARADAAHAKKAELAPLVPVLTLKLPASAPSGTVVTRDGVALSGPAIGLPLPFDPGDHVVTTQAPGGPVHEHRVKLALKERRTVELVVDAVPVAAVPVAPVATPAPASEAPVAPAHTEPSAQDSGPSPRRIGAYVAGGVGVIGLVAGAVTGGMVLGKKGDIEDGCVDEGGEQRCNAVGADALDSAQTLGLVSTIGFGVGIAGLGAAAVLLFTDSAGQESATLTPVVGLGYWGARGTF